MSQKIENAREKLMTSGRNFLLRNRDGKNGKFSVRDLTTECDMALGTFYRYFQSKDDLVRRILSEEWDRMIDSLNPIMQSDTTLFERSAAFTSRSTSLRVTTAFRRWACSIQAPRV